MKPVAFDFAAPRTISEGLALLSEVNTAPLAGGQSLVPLLNLRKARPSVVLDLNRLRDLDFIDIGAEMVRIGAMTRMRALERHPGLRHALPVLPAAVAHVANRVVRTRGTLGGSLCQADPDAELPVLAVALEARLHLRSARGDRIELAGTFFDRTPLTSRAPDELLVAVEFPLQTGFRWRFTEVPRRHVGGPPLVSACIGTAVADGIVTAARVAAGGMQDRPIRLARIERALTGAQVGSDLSGVLNATEPDIEPSVDRTYRSAVLRAALSAVLSDNPGGGT